MRPRLPAPEDVVPIALSEGEELVVYRVVLTDDRDSAEYARSFLSHAELGLPPRPGSPEETYPLIYEGISVYESRRAAIETARRYPRIGKYVAELRITHEAGVGYFRWGRPRGHLTIWGDSLKLSQAVVDILAIN